MKREIRFVIPAGRAGTPLVDFLLARFPYHTREGWTERIRQKRLLLDGRKATEDAVLKGGQVLEYDATDIPEPLVNTSVQVLFEDRDILVVDKPPNLPTHPGGRYFHHTLWAILRREHGIDSPEFVNRLDRETSGLVLVAKTDEGARSCRHQFAGRNVHKRYDALIEGSFERQVEARGFLVADASAEVRKKRRFVAVEGERPAGDDLGEWVETLFRPVSRNGEISRVEVVPLTGRLHQIRATLQALGRPVVGDKLYGVDPSLFLKFCRDQLTDDDRKRLRMDRQALHAAVLELRHPRNGRPLRFEAPLPADMAALIGGASREGERPLVD